MSGTADATHPASEPDSVVDLLTVAAAWQLAAADRLAASAKRAPSASDAAALTVLAGACRISAERLSDRLADHGVVGPLHADVGSARPVVDPGRSLPEPTDWVESLVQTFITDGLAADLFGELAADLPGDDRDALVSAFDHDAHRTAVVVDRVCDAVAADPRRAGPLALWARWLMGEGLATSYRMLAERPALCARLATATGPSPPHGDRGPLARVLPQLAAGHVKRMEALGLQP